MIPHKRIQPGEPGHVQRRRADIIQHQLVAGGPHAGIHLPEHPGQRVGPPGGARRHHVDGLLRPPEAHQLVGPPLVQRGVPRHALRIEPLLHPEPLHEQLLRAARGEALVVRPVVGSGAQLQPPPGGLLRPREPLLLLLRVGRLRGPGPREPLVPLELHVVLRYVAVELGSDPLRPASRGLVEPRPLVRVGLRVCARVVALGLLLRLPAGPLLVGLPPELVGPSVCGRQLLQIRLPGVSRGHHVGLVQERPERPPVHPPVRRHVAVPVHVPAPHGVHDEPLERRGSGVVVLVVRLRLQPLVPAGLLGRLRPHGPPGGPDALGHVVDGRDLRERLAPLRGRHGRHGGPHHLHPHGRAQGVRVPPRLAYPVVLRQPLRQRAPPRGEALLHPVEAVLVQLREVVPSQPGDLQVGPRDALSLRPVPGLQHAPLVRALQRGPVGVLRDAVRLGGLPAQPRGGVRSGQGLAQHPGRRAHGSVAEEGVHEPRDRPDHLPGSLAERTRSGRQRGPQRVAGGVPRHAALHAPALLVDLLLGRSGGLGLLPGRRSLRRLLGGLPGGLFGLFCGSLGLDLLLLDLLLLPDGSLPDGKSIVRCIPVPGSRGSIILLDGSLPDGSAVRCVLFQGLGPLALLRDLVVAFRGGSGGGIPGVLRRVGPVACGHLRDDGGAVRRGLDRRHLRGSSDLLPLLIVLRLLAEVLHLVDVLRICHMEDASLARDIKKRDRSPSRREGAAMPGRARAGGFRASAGRGT